MAHIRRYFEQALAENRQMAEHALKEIQLLYRIEHDCDQMQLTENERMGKRQELAGPIMDALKLWMETEGIKYSPNSRIFHRHLIESVNTLIVFIYFLFFEYPFQLND